MQFTYRARTQEGKMQTGLVESKTRQIALEILQKNYLVVIELEEFKKNIFLSKNFIQFYKKIRSKELVIFSRSFSALFEAGIPIADALKTLSEGMINKRFKEIILDITDGIEGGNKLSEELSQYPEIFSEFYINMIKSGEASGNLDKVLFYLADYEEKNYKLKSNIKSAMTYPIFVISVFVIVGIIMLNFVVPRLTEILNQMQGANELPFMTKIIIKMSELTSESIFIIIAAMIGIISYFVYFLKTKKGKDRWHSIQLKLPFFGLLFKNIYQARFASNLSTLIQGGVPIIEALDITSKVIDNSVYEKAINDISEKVRAGSNIESVIENYKEFSPLIVEMIAVGEKSGKLSQMLDNVSEFFSNEADIMVGQISSYLEPIMIIVLGVGTALLVGAVITPIYSIISGIGG